ncbi:serine/threonine protein kinase [Leucobacter muris]|uniref:non-specific serine/threonine protein kinase n=1 Tax=Leucobacter muris TaxID=1935379 RepID=A0ABX5QCH3_9MICO|nr:serine/threonine-protein kinase [Leucobacter muris]QAB16774.1 serine/threonine protein kinase [Leucobacter muris]
MADAIPVSPPRISGFNYVRPLGSGGFAHVYQYEQDMPRRVVAVKVLTGGDRGGTIGASPEDRSAFDAEADAMARLSSHPSIVSIFAASISSDGHPYIAMEFCPESFRHRSNGNPIPLDQVLDAGVRLAGALETAHRAGILHRDIKPSNVLLATTGRPVLADFGIVSLRGQMRGTGTSEAMSIPWAAPEVIDRSTAGTAASEVWSLAATLYTFAAGRSPFARDDGEKDSRKAMSDRIRRARYTPVPGAQGYEAFDGVMAAALAKQPEQRFASMQQFGEALQQLQRLYGYDVTPLDVVRSEWVPPVATATGVRGPVVSSVQADGRALKRAELERERAAAEESRGVRRERGAVLRPVLIGAGSAAVVLLVAAVLFAVLGGR